MKHLLLTAVVAASMTIFGPHSISDVGTHITHAGILIVRLGMALDPPRAREDWYDADEDDPFPYLEQTSCAERRA